MRTIIQRVQEASVTVNGKVHGKIGRGFLVLLGVCEGDTQTDGKALAAKCAKLRVFEDEAGKMNLGLSDIGGSVLAVSNFTLYADCSHGNRPSFSGAARPELALPLYESFCEELRKLGIPTETGIFGADMKLALINDGPVTIVMDAKDGKVLGI